MTLLLSIDAAYVDVRANMLAIGRQTLPVEVVDSAAIANTWAAVLVAGNVSGGTNPTVSVGDVLVFDSVGGVAASGNQRVGAPWALRGLDGTSATVDLLDWDGTTVCLGDDTPTAIIKSGAGGVAFRVQTVTRARVTSSELVLVVPTIEWASSALSPTITQDGNAGQQLSMRAQSGTTGVPGGAAAVLGGSASGSSGGDVFLRPGSGTTGYGDARIEHAGADVAVRVSQVGSSHTGGQAVLVDNNGLGFFNGTTATRPSVTGAKAGNAALASLLTALDSMGLITDNTT